MISKTLCRRLDRLEAGLMTGSDPRLMQISVIALDTGEVIQRILTPWNNPRDRGRRTRPWRQKAYEGDRQTPAPA